MPTPFIMPKIDMDQETATVVEWLKKDGDTVKIDEILLIIETDKVAIEVTAPESGVLAGISAKPGDVVLVTTVIAYILAKGETTADLPQKIQEGAELERLSQIHQLTASPVAEQMALQLGIDLSRIPIHGRWVTKADVEKVAARTTLPGYVSGGRVRIPATLAARKLARDLKVDLENVTGSVPRGRVQVADVQTLVGRLTDQAIRGKHVSKRLALTSIRRTIAERMQTSFQSAPHIALTVEVNMTHFEQLRADLNAAPKQSAKQNDNAHSETVKEARMPDRISVTALLVKGVAWALSRHSFVNASLVEGEIHFWRNVNIGIATAIEGGLIVPVIHNADHLSVSQINRRLFELTERARAGDLSLAEVQGGTFTISNLGMFSIDQFRAIINPPESAILAVGRLTRKPVVVNDHDEKGVRPMMNLTLSADYRVVDGIVAAQFLSDIIQAIESPDLYLL